MAPQLTPIGLMAEVGMSPRPTSAPDSHLLPAELRRRQNLQYPPPPSWCGFLGGVYDNALTCSSALTCVRSGSAVGCCSATTGICTNMVTSCLDYGSLCGPACQADPGILSCGAAVPFCGTYNFGGGTKLLNCDSTPVLAVATVELLNDFYVTAIGSTLGTSNNAAVSLGPTSSISSLASATGSATNSAPYTYNTDSSTTTSSDSSDDGGLSIVALRGIIAAAVIVGAFIFALIAFFCVRARRKRRFARAKQSHPPAYTPGAGTAPPMQQVPSQQPQNSSALPGKAFDGYQAVPQHDQTQQYTQYPSPPLNQEQQQPQQQQQQDTRPVSYFPPPGSVSPPPPASSTLDNGRQSTYTAPSPLSASPSNATDPHLHSSSPPPPSSTHYNNTHPAPPLSPAITEVDGTMGNPGVVPSPGGQHGSPSEVDATMGNPGVPATGTHGHGQGSGQGTTEIAGNPVPASLNAPWSDQGPYEMHS